MHKAKVCLSLGVSSLLVGCGGVVGDGGADAGTPYEDCASPTWAGTVQLGTYEDDAAFDVGVDATGNIYIAGLTQGVFAGAVNHGLEDMLVVALDPTGSIKWSVQLGSPGSDSAERIAVAPGGTTLIAGYATGDVAGPGSALGDHDSAVARISPAGGLEWIVQRGSAAYDAAAGIAMDSTGAAIVAGITLENQAQASEIYASKLGPGGMPMADERLGTQANEAVGKAALNAQGSLYIAGGTTGLFGNFGGGSFDVYLTKLAPSLTVEWVRQFGTVDIDGGQSVEVDDAGDAYVAAVSYSNLVTGALEGDGVRDAFLLKYDSGGALQWVSRPAWTPGKHTVPWDVAVAKGVIYMVGWTEGDLAQMGNKGGKDAFVLKVNAMGALEWARQLGSAGDDEARAVVVDGAGRVLVAGFTEGGLDGHVPLGKKDIFLAAFDATGTKL